MPYQKDKSSKCSRNLHKRELSVPRGIRRQEPTCSSFQAPSHRASSLWAAVLGSRRASSHSSMVHNNLCRGLPISPVFLNLSCRPLSKYYFLLCETYRADPCVSVPFRIDSSCQVDQSLDLGQQQCVVMILNTQLSCVGFGCRLCWWLEAVEKAIPHMIDLQLRWGLMLH